MATDKFRTPDVHWGDLYIWYGPGETADEIENITTAYGFGNQWVVTEYQFVGGYEMYERGVREWISQAVDVEAPNARRAASIGVNEISDRGGEESEMTTKDLVIESVLPPRGMTWKQWKKTDPDLRKKRKNPVENLSPARKLKSFLSR